MPKSILARKIESTSIPRGCVGISWLGQAGFILKSPKGCRIAIDPYLSNSCESVGRTIGVNFRRQFPAPISSDELTGYEAIVFTHSHQDHVDPTTVKRYLKSGGNGFLIAPHEAAKRLLSLGADAGRVLVTWPNHVEKVGDFIIRATFAIPPGPDDLTHVGYLVSVAGGPTIYFTGDTDFNEILAKSVSPFRPDVMVTVINPAFCNLSPREAAILAKSIGPRWVIPSHHDLFPDNSLPDRLLRTNLIIQGIGQTFRPLRHGSLDIFRKSSARRV